MLDKKSRDKRIDKLNEGLQKGNIEDWLYLIGSKKQIMIRNLMAGIFRGIGIGIGVTIITAILIYILQKIIRLNIPIIGDFISDIVDVVERKQY